MFGNINQGITPSIQRSLLFLLLLTNQQFPNKHEVYKKSHRVLHSFPHDPSLLFSSFCRWHYYVNRRERFEVYWYKSSFLLIFPSGIYRILPVASKGQHLLRFVSVVCNLCIAHKWYFIHSLTGYSTNIRNETPL